MAEHTAVLIRILAMAENSFGFPHILKKASCKCYYFASTVHWIKLSGRKITNVKFALYTAPALYNKTMFIQLSMRTAPFPPAFRTTSFRNFIMLRLNVICLDKDENPNIRSLYAICA